MQSVSEKYIDYISRKSVVSTWRGTIRFDGGTSINFDESMLDQNKSKITKQCVSGENLEIGNVFASELVLGLRDKDGWSVSSQSYNYYDAEISLWFRLYEDEGNYEEVFCGKFIVNKAERTYHSVILTAYDSMNKFNAKLPTKLTGEYSVYDALSTVCSIAHVTLGMAQADLLEFPNHNLELKMSAFKKGASLKDMLGSICAILGANAASDRYGRLILMKYGQQAVRTIGAQNRYSSSYVDYKGRYETMYVVNKEGEVDEYVVSGHLNPGERSLAMNMGKNILLNAMPEEDFRPAVLNILDYINDILYAPCNIKMPVDPSLDLGDLLTISGGELTSSVDILCVKMEIPLFGQMKIVSEAGSYEIDVDEYYTKSEQKDQEKEQEQKEKDKEIEDQIRDISEDIGDVEDDIRDIRDSITDINSDITNISTKMAINYIFPYQINTGGISDGSNAYVLRFKFKCDREGDTVSFYSTVCFQVHTTVSGNTYNDCVVNVQYLLDGSSIASFSHTYGDGHMILTLNGVMANPSAGEHLFDVKFALSGGSIS